MTNDEYKAKYLNILTEGYFRFRDLVIVEENKLIFRNDKLLWECILYIIIGIVCFLFYGLMTGNTHNHKGR